jgi:hypothetical protein
VAWLLPELEEGVEPELRPLDEELDEEFELPVELELLDELGLADELDEVDELELVELLVDEEPVDAVAALCVDPGRPRATTPAVTTLAKPTAVVAERTLARPRCLAARARTILSRFMVPILGSGN